jgi:hypothetical protein
MTRRVPLSRVVESTKEAPALRNGVSELPDLMPPQHPERGPVCRRGLMQTRRLSIARNTPEMSL